MREDNLESIIRQKLAALELSADPSHWEELCLRLELAFDALIQEKFAQLEIAHKPTDWQAMQAQLDQAFDQAIASQLSSIQLSARTSEWGQMRAHLEDMPLEAAMANKLSEAELDFRATDWEALEASLDEHQLDTQIREGLNSVELAEAADWNLMEAALDQAFDQQVKTQLSDFRAPFQKADWRVMAATLDEYHIDTAFRERLAFYQLPLVAADWPIMAEKLEAPFDEVVRHKFAGLQYQASAKDWRQMAALLDAQIIPAEKAVVWYANWRNYSSAAAAILLLLFTLLGGSDSWRLRTTEQLAVDSESGFILPDVHTGTLLDPALTENIASADNGAERSAKPLDQNSDNSIAQDSQAIATENPTTYAAINPLDRNNGIGRAPSLQPDRFQNSVINASLKNTKIPHENDPGEMSAYLQLIDYSEIRRVGPISFGEGRLDGVLNTAPESGYETKTWKPTFRVGLYGSNARTFAELTDDQAVSGYTYGARVEIVLNDNLSVISGLNYSEKRFRHTYPFFDAQRGIYENALEGQLFLWEAPLLLRYQLGMNERTQTRFYVQAGVVAQVSTQENYWHYNANNTVNISLERSLQYKTLSPEKLERGFNTYAGNLHASFGVDYPIIDRLSVQLEPYLLMGLQPTKGAGTAGLNKRLTTVGLGLGLQYNLNKE